MKPTVKPNRHNFSSGPCVKFPGWSLDGVQQDYLGRSHRSKHVQDRIDYALEKTRQILNVPSDYYVCITPGSATGAMEMLMWNLIGPRGVDVFAWDVFGQLWDHDLNNRLPVKGVRSFIGSPDSLPDLTQYDSTRDVVFTWNGSTSGMAVPNMDWVPDDREGLTFCDATSAMFAYDMPWHKLDATCFSWQKALGSEAAHGMIILSPAAYERLQSFTPEWSIPLVLRMKYNGEIVQTFFEGWTLNTPSVLCIEDYILALNWAEGIGGLPALCQRSIDNAAVIDRWLEGHPTIGYAAKDPATRSRTTVCFHPKDPKWESIIKAVEILESENVAYDIKGHRLGQPGLRMWCGPTVEKSDIEAVLPWIDWAWEQVR